MNDFTAHWHKHLRITILKLMLTSPGYSTNESILHRSLPGLSFVLTRDQVRTELAWLAQQGLIVVNDLQGLMVAELTLAGQDVAEGHGTHPDVQRPSARRH